MVADHMCVFFFRMLWATVSACRLLAVEHEKTKHEKPNHHGKPGGVVWVGSQEKAFVLVVSVWADWDLLLDVDGAPSLAAVVNHKLEYTVRVRHMDGGCKRALDDDTCFV